MLPAALALLATIVALGGLRAAAGRAHRATGTVGGSGPESGIAATDGLIDSTAALGRAVDPHLDR